MQIDLERFESLNEQYQELLEASGAVDFQDTIAIIRVGGQDCAWCKHPMDGNMELMINSKYRLHIHKCLGAMTAFLIAKQQEEK